MPGRILFFPYFFPQKERFDLKRERPQPKGEKAEEKEEEIGESGKELALDMDGLVSGPLLIFLDTNALITMSLSPYQTKVFFFSDKPNMFLFTYLFFADENFYFANVKEKSKRRLFTSSGKKQSLVCDHRHRFFLFL